MTNSEIDALFERVNPLQPITALQVTKHLAKRGGFCQAMEMLVDQGRAKDFQGNEIRLYRLNIPKEK